MIARALVLLALTLSPAAAVSLDDLPPERREAIARAAVGLAFAHGCATFIASPTLVRDGLRLLELAYLRAGLRDPVGLASDAYWKIVTTLEDGQFGTDGIFDLAACGVVQSEIGAAVDAAQ